MTVGYIYTYYDNITMAKTTDGEKKEYYRKSEKLQLNMLKKAKYMCMYRTGVHSCYTQQLLEVSLISYYTHYNNITIVKDYTDREKKEYHRKSEKLQEQHKQAEYMCMYRRGTLLLLQAIVIATGSFTNILFILITIKSL